MGRSLRAVILFLLLVGCSGNSPDVIPPGLLNQTQHSDADLWTVWRAAQQSVARQVDLNPLQRFFDDAPPDIRPGDPRALRTLPHQLRVAPEPDVASSVLLAATGVSRADPTGMIACPPPCNVRYATAYSRYERPVTRYAASWEFAGDNFSVILQYEFENQILYLLGYNMRWR
jgi:hypothetical protein